eukprot:3894139-Pyramimonas_sp.AAC.1
MRIGTRACAIGSRRPLPVRRHLPRRVYTALITPYPDSSSHSKDPSLCALSHQADSVNGNVMRDL